MNINTLVNYKHSLFTIMPKTTEHLKIVKSKIYGGVEYVVRDNSLVMLIDTSSVARASRELWYTVQGDRAPSHNDYEMFDDDVASGLQL